MSSNKSIDPFFYREIRRAQYELESRRLGNISNSLYLPEQRRPFEELPPNIVDSLCCVRMFFCRDAW